MSDAANRFESMGLDVAMLVDRRSGIAETERQLQEAIMAKPGTLYDGAAHIDEADAIRAALAARVSSARAQTAHLLNTNDYVRDGMPDEPWDVALHGEEVFAWIAANQILSGVEPEEATEKAGTMLTSLTEAPESPVYIQGERSSLIVLGVGIGQIVLSADFRPDWIDEDRISFDGGRVGYQRSAGWRNGKWERASAHTTDSGIVLPAYPADIFTPGGESKAKVLLTASDIDAHLTGTAEFSRAPELALALDTAGVLDLEEHREKQLGQDAREHFDVALPVLAKRAIRNAMNTRYDTRDYGENQLLVDELMNRGFISFPTAQNALQTAIVEELINSNDAPQQPEFIADMLRTRHGRKGAQEHLNSIAEDLSAAIASPTDSVMITEPLFKTTILASISSQAAAAHAEGLIGKKELKRIERFVENESA